MVGPFGIDKSHGDSEGPYYLDVQGLMYGLAPWIAESFEDILHALVLLNRQVISKSATIARFPPSSINHQTTFLACLVTPPKVTDAQLCAVVDL